MALGSSALLAPTLLGQNQQQAPPVKPGQEPKTESQAASNYPHPSGVFINRPLTQISKDAEALLDDMEGRGCDFFYEQASPKTGLVRDRAPAAASRAIGRGGSRVASIAATGFGLSALCIAAKRNYLRPSDCEQRVEKTLAFLLEDCPHEHGFLYHFIDIETGERKFNSELSSIDTALLLCGVLLCREYFEGNTRIQALLTTFYRRIDWQWIAEWKAAWRWGGCPNMGFLKVPLGHLLRADDHVPVGHWPGPLIRFRPRRGMSYSVHWWNSWGDRVHQRGRAHLYSSVCACLVRLPATSGTVTPIILIPHHSHAGATNYSAFAAEELSVDGRREYVGNYSLRFTGRLPGLGRGPPAIG